TPTFDRVIREEQLGNTGLRSSLTMRHSQGDTPTLLCLSTNTHGSSSLQLYVVFRFQCLFFSLTHTDMTVAERFVLIGCLLQDSPPKPKLTPVKVEVTEGSSVSLSCSAAAPCPTLPPTLTWTPRLSDSEDQLQENQDQTKSVSSVLTFTASHLHHGQKITCTALYKLQQGDTQKTSETIMPQISGSGSCSRTAAEISCSCESRGNPSPSMEWRVSGLRVTNSTDRVIREEQLGNTGLRSSLTMRHSQGDTPTLLCLITNTVGNASLQLHVPCLEYDSEMTGAERFILIGCLLQGTLSREWAIWMPQSIEALSGSCVLIPCRFEIQPQYDKDLVAEAKGLWMKGGTHQDRTVFDAKNTSSLIQGKITGDLLKKNCTTILEKFPLSYNDTYFFRLIAQDPLKYNFQQGVQINVQDSPPKPKLTPVKVEVTEGSSVSLSCSAAAPCPTLPPTLTWTPRLSDSEDQLQENQDQTKSVSSVLTFTASHLHHGQKITCTALYKLQQEDTQKTSEASLTLSVLRTAAEISCSCESRGNPSPSMEWRVSGLRVTNSTDRVIREEQLGNTGLRSSLTMRHSQGDTPTPLCLSTNTLGSSSLQLHVPSLECYSMEEDPLHTNYARMTARPKEQGGTDTQAEACRQAKNTAESHTLHYASVKFSERRNNPEPPPAPQRNLKPSSTLRETHKSNSAEPDAVYAQVMLKKKKKRVKVEGKQQGEGEGAGPVSYLEEEQRVMGKSSKCIRSMAQEEMDSLYVEMGAGKVPQGKAKCGL
ncbi:hypothetical protein JZ751_006460, partial [Albula glossodonta]